MITPKKWTQLTDRLKSLGVQESDLKEGYISGASKGGQKGNKATSGVLLTHEPTQTVIRDYGSRSRELNRYHARQRLCDELEFKQLGKLSAKQKAIDKKRKQKKRRARRREEGPGSE